MELHCEVADRNPGHTEEGKPELNIGIFAATRAVIELIETVHRNKILFRSGEVASEHPAAFPACKGPEKPGGDSDSVFEPEHLSSETFDKLPPPQTFKAAIPDLFRREGVGPTLTHFCPPSQKNAAIFPLIPVVCKKMGGGYAVTINEHKVCSASSPDCLVQHCILPPSPVLVPEMDEREPALTLHCGNKVGNSRIRAVITDDHFEILE